MTEEQAQSGASQTESAEAGAFGDELAKGSQLLQGQYRIARYLNSGGFGITYLARDSLDRIVVIKECFPSAMCCRQDSQVKARSKSNTAEFEKIVKLFGQEARALAKLEHPNIVGVHQVFEDNHTAYMALDFVRGRDLLDIVEEERERLTPELIRTILKKTLEAVEYVHERGLLHRDISPDNILLDGEDEPILIDFGAAREEATRRSRVLSAQHTVKDGYSPQEFYVAGSVQSDASDLYALGATFYHLIAGEPPPVSQTRLAAVAENKPDPYTPLASFAEGFDDHFLAAIDRALQIFPDDRIQSAREWLDEIDDDRRQEAAAAVVERDTNLQSTIRQLVEETNRLVAETAAPEADTRKKRRGRKVDAALGQQRRSLFPDLMGPPPPERKDAISDEDIAARPQIAPASAADDREVKKKGRRRAFERISKISLWRLAGQDDTKSGTAGKVK